MKNTYLFAIIILLSFSVSSQVIQDDAKFKATYKLTFQPDSTDVASQKEETMYLYIGDELSRFASSGTIIKDSLMANRDKSNKNPAALRKLQDQVPSTVFNYNIYFNKNDKNTLVIEKILKNRYFYEVASSQLDWQIFQETDTIKGYKVQKATTSFAGRDYEAWFNSEIPISSGPYKFNGLPGLIINISDSQNHYVFELTEFKILREPLTMHLDLSKYIKATPEEVRDAQRKFDNDPLGGLKEIGITLGFEPGQREDFIKEHRQEMKKKNNPLELKF